MPKFCFVSDLHGREEWFERLISFISEKRPKALLMGGDICPHPLKGGYENGFLQDYLIPRFSSLQREMHQEYPQVIIILGNDDPRSQERTLVEGEGKGLWRYLNASSAGIEYYTIMGYPFVPPTPFQLKDWERYDVSRYVDPGCISPEEGMYSVDVAADEKRYRTIREDLTRLAETITPQYTIMLFHSPPYKTKLDRAELDGKMIDYVPLDVNVGSIAIREFIEAVQPRITLHGHVHESSRLTGSWKECLGRTRMFSAAYEGPELAVIEFDPDEPSKARRHLLS